MSRLAIFLVILAGLMTLTGLRGAEPDGERQKLKQEIKQREAELADAQKKLAQALDSLSKAATALEAVKAEIKAIDEQLKMEQEKVRKLAQQNKEYKEEAIKARIDLQAKLDGNQKLLDKLIETDRKLAALQGGNVGRPVTNPPAKDLSGKVTAIDATTGQITVSLGKPDGLVKGHTLEVYRLKPKAAYVGMLLIAEVRDKESVGKLLGTGPRGSVQVGDDVSSRILGDK